jgi:hypothetical protein
MSTYTTFLETTNFNGNFILTSLESHSCTYLPHSTLDTLDEFCLGSSDIYTKVTSYTELALERVWLCGHSIPRFGVQSKVVSGCNEAHETERRSWPGSQFNQGSR